jgi:hypothetical protein
MSELGSGDKPQTSVDFHTFVLSLGTSAMYHLGEIPDPDGGEAKVSLPLARQTIEILSMLAEKTRGNLSAEEDQLLTQLLYDLKFRFVSRNRAGK